MIAVEAFQETADEDSFHEPPRGFFAVSDVERAEDHQALHALFFHCLNAVFRAACLDRLAQPASPGVYPAHRS